MESFVIQGQTVLESVTAMAVELGFSVLGLDYSTNPRWTWKHWISGIFEKEEGASNQVAPEIEKKL